MFEKPVFSDAGLGWLALRFDALTACLVRGSARCVGWISNAHPPLAISGFHYGSSEYRFGGFGGCDIAYLPYTTRHSRPIGCAEETKRMVCGLVDALPCVSASCGSGFCPSMAE